MHKMINKKNAGIQAGIIAIAITMSLILLVWFMELLKADFSYLFVSTGGDASLEQMGVQNLMETGSRNLSNRLGGQWGQQLYSYPVFDALNYGIMKIISLFTGNSATVVNIFYIVTFPLAAATASLAMLQLKFSKTLSLFCGLLYAFSSYHFIRNQSHLLLSAYYMVPLGVLIILQYMETKSIDDPKGRKLSTSPFSPVRFTIYCLIIVALSSTGIYYTYFFCFFLSIALAKEIFYKRRWTTKIFAGITFLSLAVLGTVMNYFPNWLYFLQGGEKIALPRSQEGAEIYSLKLIDFFLPNASHRFDLFREWVRIYRTIVPTNGESAAISLGIMGSIGLILLLLRPLLQVRIRSLRTLHLANATFLTYAGFLLSTVGGVGVMISWLGFSSIRAYSRIVVFIFFFSLVALAVLIEGILWGQIRLDQNPRSNLVEKKGLKYYILKHRAKLVIFLLPIFVLALYDQVPNWSSLNHTGNREINQATRQYFQKIEANLEPNSLVFQLPYVAFPEPDISFGSGPYSHLDGYLNTQMVRWSYGGMKGSKSDLWAKQTATLSPEAMIKELRKQGYSGIYIDLRNYPDDSLEALKNRLLELTGGKEISSEKGERCFIKL